MEHETRRFRTESDDGDEVIVIEYQRFREHKDLSGARSITKGLKVFKLTDGSRVNQIDPETFEIVQTQQIIRKVR